MWGGRRLAERFGRALPEGAPVGESWEVYGDLPVSGEEATLDDLCRRYGREFLGSASDPEGGFPLLVKWLDCHQWLSLQVHPDDERARALTGDPAARGKTECWHVVEAREGAELIHGLRPGVTEERLRRARGRELLELVNRLRPRPGDTLFTPAGTVHALGPGLLLLEVQQSCDLTYRLYDWDRPGLDGRPRPLHREQALRSILESRPPPAVQPEGVVGRLVAACPYFAVEEIVQPVILRPGGRSFEILTLLRGSARVQGETLSAGDSVVLPACLEEIEVRPQAGSALLRTRVP